MGWDEAREEVRGYDSEGRERGEKEVKLKGLA